MRKYRFFLALLAVAASLNAYAQPRQNRLNIELGNYYNCLQGDYGQGNQTQVGLEWLPASHNSFGVLTDDKPAFGAYYRSTLNAWEDKRSRLDTGFNSADFRLQSFGLIGLKRLGSFDIIGRMGLNMLSYAASNKIQHNLYIDSVFSESITDRYVEKRNNLGWQISLQIIRFDEYAKLFFRNSLQIDYASSIEAETKFWKNGTAQQPEKAVIDYLSLMAETNVADINFTDKIGFDPRVQIGWQQGDKRDFSISHQSHLVLGASVSLVPRQNRENDILQDAVQLGYAYHSDKIAGHQVYVKLNLLSFARLWGK